MRPAQPVEIIYSMHAVHTMREKGVGPKKNQFLRLIGVVFSWTLS